jgi:hypothetical protein
MDAVRRRRRDDAKATVRGLRMARSVEGGLADESWLEIVLSSPERSDTIGTCTAWLELRTTCLAHAGGRGASVVSA